MEWVFKMYINFSWEEKKNLKWKKVNLFASHEKLWLKQILQPNRQRDDCDYCKSFENFVLSSDDGHEFQLINVNFTSIRNDCGRGPGDYLSIDTEHQIRSVFSKTHKRNYHSVHPVPVQHYIHSSCYFASKSMQKHNNKHILS